MKLKLSKDKLKMMCFLSLIVLICFNYVNTNQTMIDIGKNFKFKSTAKACPMSGKGGGAGGNAKSAFDCSVNTWSEDQKGESQCHENTRITVGSSNLMLNINGKSKTVNYQE